MAETSFTCGLDFLNNDTAGLRSRRYLWLSGPVVEMMGYW